jgi:hypothetical protein
VSEHGACKINLTKTYKSNESDVPISLISS